MTYKNFKDGVLRKIDERIDNLLKMQNEKKEYVSMYLPEEVRDFTWGVRKIMLEDSLLDGEGGEEVNIRRLLDDISKRTDIMLELLELRKEINGIK